MNRKKRFNFFWLTILLMGLAINGCQSHSQVVNNSGSLLNQVRIGRIPFSENLDYCSTGCSTAFKWVFAGKNRISLRETEASPWIPLNALGPFMPDTFHAVNVRNQNGIYCADLWVRPDTGGTFNSDNTKEVIQTLCPEGTPQQVGCPMAQVTNNSGIKISGVKIGNIGFSQIIDNCPDGCSTGFSVVSPGKNQILMTVKFGMIVKELTRPLGPFENGSYYSVNIVKNDSGTLCAELWRRKDTESEFNADTTRNQINTGCFR